MIAPLVFGMAGTLGVTADVINPPATPVPIALSSAAPSLVYDVASDREGARFGHLQGSRDAGLGQPRKELEWPLAVVTGYGLSLIEMTTFAPTSRAIPKGGKVPSASSTPSTEAMR